VDLSTLGTLGGVCTVFAGGAWKLATAWTKKAIAIGEKAEAERAAARELAELRVTFAKFMERMQAAEMAIKMLETRMEERERAQHRRDTLGIPVRSDVE